MASGRGVESLTGAVFGDEELREMRVPRGKKETHDLNAKTERKTETETERPV